MFKNRVSALMKEIAKANIGALLVTRPENIYYLTSLSADRLVLVVSQKKPFAVTDFIYAETASRALKGFSIFSTRDSLEKVVSEKAGQYRLKRIGFESLSISLAAYRRLRRAFKGEVLYATKDIVESLREVKKAPEISLIKKAVSVTRKVYARAKRNLKPSATESRVTGCIKESIIREGGEGWPFEPIVATQPSASQPHSRPSAKKLGSNKLIMLDMGAAFKGYNSDLTRMIPLGKISPKFRSLYNILLEAQRRAIERVQPGARISQIDLAARQYICNRGFGKYFGHALGHGVGLNVHERPHISHKNFGELKPGMVFTIEPGIYIPRYGGLRIEDMVLVTDKGCKVLTGDIDKSI